MKFKKNNYLFLKKIFNFYLILKKILINRKFIIIFLIFIILFSLWIWTFSVTTNFILSGGSTSVDQILNKITQQFYNDKNIDIIYNSLGSSAAISNVKNKNFAFGFLSKKLDFIPSDINKKINAKFFWNNNKIISFAFAKEIIILIYHLPKNCFLNFNKNLILGSFSSGELTNFINKIYSDKSVWQKIFKNNISCSINNSEFFKITRESGSGTREFFENNIIKSKTYSFDRVVSSNGDMYKAISSTPGSVGYLSFSFLKQIKDDKNLGIKSIFGIKEKGIEEFPFKTDNFGNPIINNIFNQFEFNKNYSLVRPFIGIINTNHKKFISSLNFISWMIDPEPYKKFLNNKNFFLKKNNSAYWYLKEGVIPLTECDNYFKIYNNNTEYAINKLGFNKMYKSIWELSVKYFFYKKYSNFNC